MIICYTVYNIENVLWKRAKHEQDKPILCVFIADAFLVKCSETLSQWWDTNGGSCLVSRPNGEREGNGSGIFGAVSINVSGPKMLKR